MDSRVASAVDEKIASRLEQSGSGDISQTDATAKRQPTASNGTVRAGQHSRDSPNVRLTSALAHQKLKDQHEKLSAEVSLHHGQLEKQIKALAASIQNLTKQGISRDAQDETTNSRHSERLKDLESQVVNQQTRVNKDKARIDGLYSTIREIEGKIAADPNGKKTTNQIPDLAAKVTKLESLNTQLDKRVAEIKEGQSSCGKRLDELELRSRLNASIVDDLKKKVGPGFNNVEAKLGESSSKLMKALEKQRDSLQDSITNQRAYINAQISMLQKQLAEVAKCTGGRMPSGNAAPNTGSNQAETNNSEDLSSEATNLALETYKQKLKEIVAASKKKFDEHAARILGLEQAIFKPSQNALPTEERLDNLEYDVQKLKTDERGEMSGGRAVFEQVDALQAQIERLRTDVRTAFTRAVTQEAHRRALGEQESSKQQMLVRLDIVEREQAHLSRQKQSFEIRLKTMLRDCNSCWSKIQQLSESEPGTLAELQAVLKKANESFSVGLVEIKQQVELLEAGFATLGDGLPARIEDYQAAFVWGEIKSSRSSVSNSDCSTLTVHRHLSSEDLPTSCLSTGRTPQKSSGIGSIEASGSDLQLQPTSIRNTAALGHAPQGNGDAAVKGPEPPEIHSGKRHQLSENSPLSLQVHASTSPFGPHGKPFFASPEQQITSLADRVKVLEQKMLTLLKSSRPSSLDLAGASNSTTHLPLAPSEAATLAQRSSTSVSQRSEDAKLAVKEAVTDWQATLAELRAKVEQVQTDLRRFDASIKRESATLSAFKGEIQNRWSRQLGSLPPASMVHELAANYQALTNRINTLEYHLRQRRVI